VESGRFGDNVLSNPKVTFEGASMRHLWMIVAASLLAATASPAKADNLDRIATDYVQLALAVRHLEADWIDAPEAPTKLTAEADAANFGGAAIVSQTTELLKRLDKIAVPRDHLGAQRYDWLRASLISLRMQLEAKAGTKWPVSEEVRLRYGFAPTFRPLSDYDPILIRLDRHLSGSGTLSERIARLRGGSVVPADKVVIVQAAALKECRRRAAANVRFPEGEHVDLAWVDQPHFPGSNTYKGNLRSLTELSNSFKWEVDHILSVTCHEMYPGHHVHMATQSAELLRKRHWPEFAVIQNYGPLIPAAEAVAEYGVGLTFPIEDRIQFERDVLYPLAGLKMGNPDDWRAYWIAKWDMLGASATVAQLYLDGKLDKDQARAAFEKYRMMTPDGASKMVPIIDQVGSYLIASDVGWMTIDRRLRGKPRAQQWKAFQRILEEPMTVADLQKL
jgi:hypothetical protein